MAQPWTLAPATAAAGMQCTAEGPPVLGELVRLLRARPMVVAHTVVPEAAALRVAEVVRPPAQSHHNGMARDVAACPGEAGQPARQEHGQRVHVPCTPRALVRPGASMASCSRACHCAAQPCQSDTALARMAPRAHKSSGGLQEDGGLRRTAGQPRQRHRAAGT